MTVKRLQTSQRMSQVVIHGSTVYLAGQVARNAPGGTVPEQTRDILSQIDDLLELAGTNRSHLLSATIWISNMDDFAEMNTVWDNWLAPGDAPCRACTEARLASPDFTVEIMVTACLPDQE